MLSCFTDFITDTINQFIDIFLIVLVMWFLVIATLVIRAQRDSDPKDDVEQEWEAIRFYMGQHIKAAFNKVSNTNAFRRAKAAITKPQSS